MARMIHEIVPVGPLQCNCSIVGDPETKAGIVIDPGDDVDEILAIVERHGLTVTQIAISHGHIDHVAGAMELRARTGAPILINERDRRLLDMLDAQAKWLGLATPGRVEVASGLSDGDVLRAGPLRAEVLHTPGHTEGSVCLYFAEARRLIAGDTLFAGSIGRTDLPGGSFEKIMMSLHDRLLALPEETLVVPGHGPVTSIGEERQSNPFLRGGSPRRSS
jgi:glyoxylase-like metal-dependent hydrolase (beta-lactamase superfamily II)